MNFEKLLNKDKINIVNNSCITIKNFNTGKFLSINDNNNLICSKDPYNFILCKKNEKEEEEMIVTNDEIILIGNYDFNFIIAKDNKFIFCDEFNPYIFDSDIIKLISFNNRKNVICSDYQFKDKNKVQLVEIKENSNDNNQNWIINIQN